MIGIEIIVVLFALANVINGLIGTFITLSADLLQKEKTNLASHTSPAAVIRLYDAS